jgi:hypothetical protein
MLNILRGHKDLIKGALLSRAAFPIVVLMLFCGVNRVSLEIARNIYYGTLVRRAERELKPLVVPPARGDLSCKSQRRRVWVYWDAGFDIAPPIVRLCAAKLKKFDNIEVVFLTKDTIGKYISFPDHINRKHSEGKISAAHFSDLLRIELLYQFGGIWLDATVFLTGKEFPPELLTDDLFFYSMSKPSRNGNPIYISSWAMSSPPGHPILDLVRRYLYLYWDNNNKLSNYFLFHIVICAAINLHRDIAPQRLGFYENSAPHLLLLSYRSPYSSNLYEEIIFISSIHKLSYKYDDISPGSILEHLLLQSALDEKREDYVDVNLLQG